MNREDWGWTYKYVSRVNRELAVGKINESGKIPISIYVYDLLVESKRDMRSFYDMVFFLNKAIDSRIVLYLRGEREKDNIGMPEE